MNILLLVVCAFLPLNAYAADAIPKCWQTYNPKLFDGLYHIDIPASDSITAKEVAEMIFALQGFGVKDRTVMTVGDKIELEAQFISLAEGRALGYPTQEKLEGLVEYVMKDELPFLSKGVTISCVENRPPRHH